MSDFDVFDMSGLEAPDNKEKEYVTPGYRRLTVKDISYKKEEAGKTPCIVVKLTKETPEGGVLELTETFYLSGKKNDKNLMPSILRLLELYRGLTGNKTMDIKPSHYTYTKKEKDGREETFTIPHPEELCNYLKNSCIGKSSVFKIGGEIREDGTVYPKLSYSSFLYYTDKLGNLHKYSTEKDFTEVEYKRAVLPKKVMGPGTSAGLTNPAILDSL